MEDTENQTSALIGSTRQNTSNEQTTKHQARAKLPIRYFETLAGPAIGYADEPVEGVFNCYYLRRIHVSQDANGGASVGFSGFGSPLVSCDDEAVQLPATSLLASYIVNRSLARNVQLISGFTEATSQIKTSAAGVNLTV